MRILKLSDLIQTVYSNCVIVENGSGVIINPAIGEFSYILTAKHVIGIYEDNKIVDYKEFDNITVLTVDNEKIDLQSKIVHENLDIAILITKNRFEIDLLNIRGNISRNDDAIFLGFPDYRRNDINKIREFDGEIQGYDENTFVLRIKEKPNQNEVVGSSGGGVFKIIQDNIYLCGIESGMDGNAREFHGRVVCTHLEKFNELLSNNDLPKIFPSLMTSFMQVKENIFQHFDNADDPSCFQFLKDSLQEYASTFSLNGPSPIEVTERLGTRLLVRNSPVENLFDQNLWIAFIEFMLIGSLIDNIKELNFEYIDQVSKKRKFLYTANKGNWVHGLEDIFSSDFRGLEKGGIIIISSNDSRAKLSLSQRALDKIVNHIGRVNPKSLMVDTSIRNPAKEFKIFHLLGLHDNCVLNNDEEFEKYYAGNEGFDVEEMIEKFKEFYSANISN